MTDTWKDIGDHSKDEIFELALLIAAGKCRLMEQVNYQPNCRNLQGSHHNPKTKAA